MSLDLLSSTDYSSLISSRSNDPYEHLWRTIDIDWYKSENKKSTANTMFNYWWLFFFANEGVVLGSIKIERQRFSVKTVHTLNSIKLSTIQI